MEVHLDPVGNAKIRLLQDRADQLREWFLKPGARLRSNRFEITIKQQKRRVFSTDHLPQAVLANPRYWGERESEVVSGLGIAIFRAGDEDSILIA